MSRIPVLFVLAVSGTIPACSRPSREDGQGRKIVEARSRPVARKGRPAAGHRPAAKNFLAQDRLNQTLRAWVRAADRASVEGEVLKGGLDGDLGKELGTVIQACGCIAKPGWYPYFLGVARLGDRLSSLRGKKISYEADQELIKLYNETASSYNAVRSAAPALILPRVRLSDLDPRSFRHWLQEILSDLQDSVLRERTALAGLASAVKMHRLERAVRALWLSEKARLAQMRLAGMSCRSATSCRSLVQERDRIVQVLNEVVVQCRGVGRKTLVPGGRDVSFSPCVDSWKRLDHQMARTGGGPRK